MTHRRPGEWYPGDRGWIEHMMERVEELLKEHDTNSELDNLLQGRPRKNYRHRTHEELLGDVNQLYDKLVALTKERDELRGHLTKAQTKLNNLNLKFWIVSSAVVGEGCVIGFLAVELFARLH